MSDAPSVVAIAFRSNFIDISKYFIDSRRLKLIEFSIFTSEKKKKKLLCEEKKNLRGKKKVFVPTAAERWLFLADSIGGFYEEEENGKTVFICCNIFSTNLFIHVGSEKNSFTLTRSHHVVVKWRLLWSMMSSAYDCRRWNKWGNNRQQLNKQRLLRLLLSLDEEEKVCSRQKLWRIFFWQSLMCQVFNSSSHLLPNFLKKSRCWSPHIVVFS